MKIQTIILLIVSSLLLTNCMIIFGGAKYQAHIEVPGHPDADIYVNNEFKGQGNTVIIVKRKEADNLHFKIKEIGCDVYSQSFNEKKSRPLAVIGSITEVSQAVYNMAEYGTLMIPLGTILDLSIGSYWRPNIKDPNIYKLDYDNFKYILNYSTCPEKQTTNIPNKLPTVKNGFTHRIQNTNSK